MELNRGIQDQQRLEDELWVAINGPEVVHCESIVREAVTKDGSNFICRSENIKSWKHGMAWLILQITQNLQRNSKQDKFSHSCFLFPA